MFAGPNGPGKSTLKTVLPPQMLGVYLNPDDIEREMRADESLDLKKYGAVSSSADTLAFFSGSEFLKRSGLGETVKSMLVTAERLHFSGDGVNSYLASAATDFLRLDLLAARKSFTLETVMSHVSKVKLLETARDLGYRTYLYYVATEHPSINISRVANRVKRGGHPVPEDKIIKRYYGSLELLTDAIRATNRAYIFDNSAQDENVIWLAEITDGKNLVMKVPQMPAWFRKSIWEKVTAAP